MPLSIQTKIPSKFSQNKQTFPPSWIILFHREMQDLIQKILKWGRKKKTDYPST